MFVHMIDCIDIKIQNPKSKIQNPKSKFQHHKYQDEKFFSIDNRKYPADFFGGRLFFFYDEKAEVSANSVQHAQV